MFAHRFHLHVLRTKTEVRNAVQYVLRNAERHGLHDVWPSSNSPASRGLPRPDPLSTATWFPYWAERELIVVPTQISASVVRPAQCFLMKLAFEGAPLSFAEPMGKASTRKAPKGQTKRQSKGTRQRSVTTGSQTERVERVQAVACPPIRIRRGGMW